MRPHKSARYAHTAEFAHSRTCVNGSRLIRSDHRRVRNETVASHWVRAPRGKNVSETATGSPVTTLLMSRS
jgi:hypothetical protein